MAYTPFKMKGPALYSSPAKNEKPTVLPTVEVSDTADKVKVTANKDGGFTKSKGSRSQKYNLNPNYDAKSSKSGNYKYLTGEKDKGGAPIGTNHMG